MTEISEMNRVLFRMMGREKAEEVGLKGSAVIGSLRLARDKGGGRACEGKRGRQSVEG